MLFGPGSPAEEWTVDNLIYPSARALAKAIRTREVSSLEVVTACISRIEEVNPKLNAVVQTTFEKALDQARQADDDLRRGADPGPLHGVPMTIKDSLDTAGVITTAGTMGRARYVPDKDATVVARLRAAGAILLGKTNTPELTAVGITDNDVYGRTNNPYDLSRTPGGSSGGAAAIIAAGGSPFDLGSDTGGSIRLPSHFCGIAGIKPTAGRVPRTGHIISFDIGYLDRFTHIGPMARFVKDLVLLLPIISGVDWVDPTVVPLPCPSPADAPLTRLRVAYFGDNGIETPTGDTVRTLEQAVQALSAGGVTTREARPPGIEEADTLWNSLFLADGGEAIRKLLRASGTDPAEMHPSIAWTQSDRVLPARELAELIVAWKQFQSRMLAFMVDHDAILCPASATPASKHDEARRPDFSYKYPHNLTGWPVVVVRSGTSREGLPIGLQVVARPWREDVAFALAQKIEDTLGGWQPPDL
jgi:amidase